MTNNLNEQIRTDLTELCVKIGDRHPGSERNHRATDYVARRLEAAGFSVIQVEMDCIDWEYGEIVLTVGQQPIKAFIGPYNDSCEIRSYFKSASTLEELSKGDFAGKILVLHGELCKEQLASKSFVFYNPDEHKQIIALLEQKNPRAIIAITGCNPAATGGLNPFPLIEDGDFMIPSVYVSEAEGVKILNQPAAEIFICMESRRIPSQAYNVLGEKPGQISDKLVFCAHVDTKKDTPGAIDNGGSIALLLSLADLLKDYQGKYSIEILAINGEDYYAYPGGMRYLADNKDNLEQIRLVVNSDGAGSRAGRTTYCCFNVDEPMTQAVTKAFHDNCKFAETEPWYQSDHGMFAMYGVSAVALTTENFTKLWSTIAHTAQDTIDLVDSNILADIAGALLELINEINRL